MDHLLSMENLLIEKQPYEIFGASTLDCEKISIGSYSAFYLVLRDYFSQILFFEN